MFIHLYMPLTETMISVILMIYVFGHITSRYVSVSLSFFDPGVSHSRSHFSGDGGSSSLAREAGPGRGHHRVPSRSGIRCSNSDQRSVNVGQVLSTRPDIVPPVYATYSNPRRRGPRGRGGRSDVIAQELGDELDQSTLEPVAGGSLAYVYRRPPRWRIALKVRRPD